MPRKLLTCAKRNDLLAQSPAARLSGGGVSCVEQNSTWRGWAKARQDNSLLVCCLLLRRRAPTKGAPSQQQAANLPYFLYERQLVCFGRKAHLGTLRSIPADKRHTSMK